MLVHRRHGEHRAAARGVSKNLLRDSASVFAP